MAGGGGSGVRVLIVDDEPFNQEILLEYLEHSGYRLETADDGIQAWDRLQADPDSWDAVVLDRMMPGMDGMEVLRRIKQHPRLCVLPVILQTALAAPEHILEGIRAGAYYYLAKPFDEEMLRSVLGTAVEDRQHYRRLQERSDLVARTFGLMCDGRFRLQTLDAVRDLATALSNACPDPRKAVIGFSELLVNAVEHGNLEISYQDKSALKEQGTWEDEVRRRLQRPEYAGRWVEVRFHREPDHIEVTVRDQGKGFDWPSFLEMDPGRVFDTHGRGIAVSRQLSFDRMEYRGCGNEVVVALNLPEDWQG